MVHTLIAAAGLALFGATTASAQVASFDDQVRTSVAMNEQLVRDVVQALPAEDPGVLADASAAAVAQAEQPEQQLGDALAVAPADADRSRLSGVLTHTRAALSSLRQVSSETDIDAARGRLDQARGEAIEGLDELRPYAETLPASPVARPAVLPEAGSLDDPALGLLPVLGGALLAAGLGLRWWSAATARLARLPRGEARVRRLG